MKKLIILLTLVLSFSFANAKVYPSLKVKDYKKIRFVVEYIPKLNSGLTDEDVGNKVKLTLLKNGFKLKEGYVDYLYIHVSGTSLDNRINDAYKISIGYYKFAENHFDTTADKNIVGKVFRPDQGNYGSFGISTNKSDITDSVNRLLEKFLIDYIESNTE